MDKVEPPVARQGFPSLDAPSVPFPTSVIAQSTLWDESTRDALAKPRFRKRDLDARKAENLIPGTPLKPTPQDARVPVTLIQHSTETGSGSTSATTQGIHGWTLLVPNGWGMPFLSSLLFTGARVGGLRERATQAFESGAPSFPADAVDTEAYADEVAANAEEQQARWERTPPAKRVNYEDRGMSNPWRPDWRGLLGLEPLVDDDEGFMTAQRAEPSVYNEPNKPQDRDEMDVDPLPKVQNENSLIHPWVLRGPQTSNIVAVINSRLQPSSELLLQLTHLREKRNLPPLSMSEQDLWRSALVHVRFEMCNRGKPTEGAMVFAVQDDEAKAWIFATSKSSGDNTPDTVDETRVCGISMFTSLNLTCSQLSEAEPSQADLVGYVTSGNYSLTIGHAHAIGAMSLASYYKSYHQAHRYVY
jgi:ribonuclease P/MRP protein subunit POP1